MTGPIEKPSRRRPKLILSAYDLEKQLRRLSESTLGPDRDKWPYLPLKTGFAQLQEAIGGISNRFYVIASGARVGKSTLALQLVYNVLKLNKEAHCLYVSLDQPAREMNIRLVAMAGQCNTSYVQFPSAELAEKYDEKRVKGLRAALSLKDRLTIVDESLGSLKLADIASFIHQKKHGQVTPLVVVIDPLYRVREGGGEQMNQVRLETLCQEIKTLCASEQVAVIATTRLSKGAALHRPSLEDLEDQPAVLYESDVVMLLYNDSLNDGNTSFMEWEWGTDDVMVPIFELNVVKNKMGGFAGRLFYRFYNSYSRFKECTPAEIDNYNRMLLNLKMHDKEDPTVDEGLPIIEQIDVGGK